MADRLGRNPQLNVPAARVARAMRGARRLDEHETLTVFSFGYFGWGNAIDELVAVTEAVERDRGFGPPLFVDIRISRAVRAEGFRESAFERRLGHESYRWMRTLGNTSIKTGRSSIDIAAPDAVHQLLDLALDAHRDRRRVIFFCGCEVPATCHRRKVGRLLVQAAHQRGVLIKVAEWPGSPTPTGLALDLALAPEVFHGILDSTVWMPLPKTMPLGEVGLFPFGGVARIRARGCPSALVVLEGIRPRGGRWCVQAQLAAEEGVKWNVAEALRAGRRERLRVGHAALK